MLKKSVFIMVLLAPAAALAQPSPHASAPAPAPAASAAPIDCSRWHKLPDGDWRPAPGTVVNYQGASVAVTHTVADGDYAIKGQDVYTLIDETCGN